MGSGRGESDAKSADGKNLALSGTRRCCGSLKTDMRQVAEPWISLGSNCRTFRLSQDGDGRTSEGRGEFRSRLSTSGDGDAASCDGLTNSYLVK